MTRALIISALLLVAPVALADAPPEVKVLTTGSGKKQALRYKVKPGSSQRMRMTMKMDMKMTMDGRAAPSMPMPPMEFVFDGKVNKTHANGNIDYTLTLTEVGIKKEPTTDAAMAKAITEALAPLKGLKIDGTTDHRGANLRGDVKAAGAVPPQMKQTLDSMQQSMQQMSQPLPDEAVGVGAKWTVTQNIEQNGMKLKQVSTVELVKIRGTAIETKVTLVQSAAAQAVNMPGMPPGISAHLDSLSGTGTGTNVLDLGSIVPVAGTMAATSSVAMSMSGEGQNMKMEMEMGMSVKIANK